MGLFGKKAPALTKARTLKRGSAVTVVDLEPGFVEWARSAKPAVDGKDHLVTVRVQLQGDDVILMAGGGGVVGRMAPKSAPNYRDEFAWMAQRGEYGVAEVAITAVGVKEDHRLLINFDQYCRDGGIT